MMKLASVALLTAFVGFLLLVGALAILDLAPPLEERKEVIPHDRFAS